MFPIVWPTSKTTHSSVMTGAHMQPMVSACCEAAGRSRLIAVLAVSLANKVTMNTSTIRKQKIC